VKFDLFSKFEFFGKDVFIIIDFRDFDVVFTLFVDIFYRESDTFSSFFDFLLNSRAPLQIEGAHVKKF